MILLLLLCLFACASSLLHTQLHRTRYNSRLLSKLFDLEESHLLSALRIDEAVPTRGVYVVENKSKVVQHVGHSFVNIFEDINYFKQKFKGDENKLYSLRIQSFPAQVPANVIIDYKSELLAQLKSQGTQLDDGEWQILPSDITTEEKVSPMVDYKVITIGDDDDDVLELTVSNVDKVLDEVRPYLIADGGNIRVVEVDVDASCVKLELQGACGSCPSSTVSILTIYL